MQVWPKTLSGRLTLTLNTALVVLAAIFSDWDFNALIADRLAVKRAALRDEAEAIAHSVNALYRGPESEAGIHAYLDRLCQDMQGTSSPGHYILADIGHIHLDTIEHVRTPLTAEEQETVRRVARRETEGRIGDHRIVAAMASEGRATVYVAEYLSDVRRAMMDEFLRRVLGIAGLTLVLAVVVNVSIQRLARRPLRQLAAAMRRVAAGDLHAEAPKPSVDELALVSDEFNRMRQALATAEDDRQTRMARARRIQERLLARPCTIGPYRIDGFHVPADTVAGDYWDVLVCPDHCVLVCVADVSGHGIPAAMGATMLKVLLTDAVTAWPNPSEVLAQINRRYTQLILDDDFATMLVLTLSPNGDRLTYASAGHEAAVLFRRGLDEPIILEATGMPLGVDSGLTWRSESFSLAPGDRIVTVTDGVVDARGPSTSGPAGPGPANLSAQEDVSGRALSPFGRDRLINLVAAQRDRPIGEVIALIHQAVLTHLGGRHSADDMTAVGIER
jgi:sigma-B regulation protein RsbU (phosphoserine phosphatase)